MKRMLMAAGLAAVGLMLAAGSALANNLQVTNVVVTARDATTAYVKFDISWENSWRVTNLNHDAAWVFFKVRNEGDTTGWTNHVILESTGHSTGTGTGIELIVPTNGVGMFVRRAAEGVGSVTVTDVQAVWNIASSGMASTSILEMTACAVEMVYVAQGAFTAGDGTTDENKFPKTLINTADPTVAPVGGPPAAGGYPSGQTVPSTTSWPNGYNAFYCMKYEITEGQYKDFLNTLTSGQATTRNPGNYITGNYPDFTTATPNRAGGFLLWADGAAFADWAGLRPMTELEFEKACRGPLPAVAGEYAWGDTNITAVSGLQGTDGSGQEYYTAGNLNSLGNPAKNPGGPVRVGIFAKATSTREQAGASYWGIMELSGNMWERMVNMSGSGFTGLHGDGNLNASGDANVTAWPGADAVGGGFRGGGFGFAGAGSWLSTDARVSDRHYAALVYESARVSDFGWRWVRSAPSGVGP